MMRFTLAMLIAWLAVCGAVRAEITALDNDALASLIEQGVPVIDVRREDEWRATGLIPGAVPMTFFDARGQYDAPAWLAALETVVDKDEPFVLICAQGVRSKVIAQLLDRRLGYSGVHNHTQGMNEWIRGGGAVTAYSGGSNPVNQSPGKQDNR